MLRASICLDANDRMNKKIIELHLKQTQVNRAIALAAIILTVVLAACQTGLPVADLTPPPPPTAQNTEMAGLAPAAYPPPKSTATGLAIAPTDAPGAYPPAATPEPASPYPAVDRITPDHSAAATEEIYFPVIGNEDQASITSTALVEPTILPTATLMPSPTAGPAVMAQPTPISVVDFEAARADLLAQGRQLAYNKIGFHVTFLEEADELDSYMQRLDSEGVPFFLKSVDNAEPLFKAQELMKASGVPHTLVYRSTLYDVPDYSMDPVLAAETYWEMEKAIWPPELDPGLVWFETMNELDKNRSEWLAQFSLRTAELALRDGYRWAAFGWSSGEPEPEDWESPAMLELLRLIGDNPDRLAIALHEYSYVADDIGHEYPHKVGRFLDLFAVADKYNIPRPTVLITEWGWTYNNIPPEPPAMEDVAWAATLYGAYPEVLGAAIWNIGKLNDTLLPLNTQLQELIDNMLAISLDSYFSAPAPPERTPLDADLFPPP